MATPACLTLPVAGFHHAHYQGRHVMWLETCKKLLCMDTNPNESRDQRQYNRCRLGIAGLDEILRGGLPYNRLYLLQGEPGTGKTTIAFQFLLEGARRGEKGLYVSFSETADELREVAESHGWDIGGINILDLSAIEEQLKPEFENTVFHPSQVEMSATTRLLMSEVEKLNPHRVVFDSVSEMRSLAETALRYRRQMLSLKKFFSDRQCTVLFLDDLSSERRDLQVQSIVHGVIFLQKVHPEFGDERRRLAIAKVRGIEYLGGYHDYVIKRGGLRVFPRMVAADYSEDFNREVASSGIQELDSLLDGGLDRGTSTLIMGPAGTGKSTLAIQYAYAAAERGERAVIYSFEESLKTMFLRTSGLGMNLQKHVESRALHIQKIDPAELSPGEFADQVRCCVLKDGARVIVIDSLNGYLNAMPEEKFLILQLHELLAFLGNQGVISLLVLAQHGVVGSGIASTVELTYLADAVLMTRYFEVEGAVKKAISVVKKRGGSHEATIREFQFSKAGIAVGKPLTQFQGILAGIPTFRGNSAGILRDADAPQNI